jgi:tRNA(fMet)-specific endonuclease VapC
MKMSGSRVVLDSNQAIALLNGVGEIGAWVRQYPEVCLPVPVVGELLYGALNSARPEANLGRVRRLISGCRILDITASSAEQYAQVRLALRRLGRPVPSNDLWIAAICLDLRLPLATLDRHFSLVSGLNVVHA